MQEIEVEAVRRETSQAALARLAHPLARPVLRIELAHQEDLFAAARNRLADDPFGAAVGVHLGGVDERHAEIEPGPERGDLPPPVRAVLAYSPVEEGLLSCTAHPTLGEIAARHGATAAQVAIAWIIRHPGVIAIPKASRPAHVRENRGAVELRLSRRDLDELDVSFPAPTGKIPLETR